MRYSIVTAPATEPVSIAECKSHLRVEHTADDAYIAGLQLCARSHIEKSHDYAMVTQAWKAMLEQWPCGNYIQLPIGPVASVTSVKYWDSTGTEQTMSSADYVVEADARRVYLGYAKHWPVATLRPGFPITVTFVAGSAVASVPRQVKHSILLLVEHWYRNRSAVTLGNAAIESKPLAMAVDALMANLTTR
jgi:uncharacterized phiE125 gp8 family phage protein